MYPWVAQPRHSTQNCQTAAVTALAPVQAMRNHPQEPGQALIMHPSGCPACQDHLRCLLPDYIP